MGLLGSGLRQGIAGSECLQPGQHLQLIHPTQGHLHLAAGNLHMPIRTSITASATWATQNDTSILEASLPPVLWHAARALSLAQRAVLAVKIPADARPVVCARSPKMCTLSYTPHAAQGG
jgi:hypothetical protein